jgi:Ser/Thr protein kinase RdoA (MazF antagonist)
MEAGSPPTRIVAYYKVYVSELPEPTVRFAQPKSAPDVTRAVAQAERLVERTGGEPLATAHVLAADPHSLTIVTLEIPGVPLAEKMLLPRRRVAHGLTDVFRAVGRSAFLIDQCTEPGEIEPSQARRAVSDLVTYRVERFLRRWPHTRDRAFDHRLSSLIAEVEADNDFVFAHGDMRFANILVAGDTVGLIDLGWVPRPRGWDLGMTAAQLESASYRSGWGRAELLEALIDGYGTAEVVTSPGFRLAQVDRLAFNATRPGRPRRGAMVGRAQRKLEATFLAL